MQKAVSLLSPYKDTLKETFQCEDYDDSGYLTAQTFLESLKSLQIDDLSPDLLDYLVYATYAKSDNHSHGLKYDSLFDLISSSGNAAGVTASGQKRSRPESSSPEKLKARNNNKATLSKNEQEEDEEVAEQEYAEDQFEKMLDKDDEGGLEEAGDAKKKEADAYIEEDEMLDIAEKCFMRIADAIIAKEITVRDAFKKHITKEVAQTAVGENQEEVELITPMGFLEGVK